jgi:YebC/PmpR family DNA-binding regulatory protein
MSGHSKWHQIRRQKGVTDAKRGQLFTRLGREIVVAVREGGGGDPDGNARLRLAIQRARAANMPMDNIDRTIKRAMGGGEGVQLDEIRYEGYAPGGAAIMVQVMTDNRNRAAAEIRNVFSKNGGNLGEVGCVDWIFEPRGVIEVKLDGKNLDDLMMAALDAGAEDVPTPAPGDETATVYTDYNGVEDVREKLATAGYEIENSEATLVPKTKVPLSEKDGVAALRLMDKIEDLEDVQAVYTNAEISDEIAEKYAG